MTKKILCTTLALIMLCLGLCSCGCNSNTEDSQEVVQEKITQTINDYATTLKGDDVDAYNKICTANMQITDQDEINNYFNQVDSVIIKEISFDSMQHTDDKYELLVHFYITMSQNYTGSDYKKGINDVTKRFVIKKVGNDYKLDDIVAFGA